MKVLRLRLYQETACYKKPFAFKVGETYPLPPYSTVKGWLHALLKADALIPMQISIQGHYETRILDYQAYYFSKKQNSKEFPVILDGLSNVSYRLKDITQMPIYIHLLCDVHLLIHVGGEAQMLKHLKDRIKTMDVHPSLGRWEDLVRVDECRFVQLKDFNTAKPIENDAYVPIDQLDSLVARIPYCLNWTYEIRNGRRVWDTVDVGYVAKGTQFEEGEALEDEYGELAFFFPKL